MIQSNPPCDPVIHLTAARLARKCVSIIEPLLRHEEYAVARQEFYLAIRETLENLHPTEDER
jgi:hypothetical protein